MGDQVLAVSIVSSTPPYREALPVGTASLVRARTAPAPGRRPAPSAGHGSRCHASPGTSDFRSAPCTCSWPS